MDSTLLTLGAIFLLVGLIGQVKAKEIEVGTKSPVVRLILGILGAAFLFIPIAKNEFSKPDLKSGAIAAPAQTATKSEPVVSATPPKTSPEKEPITTPTRPTTTPKSEAIATPTPKIEAAPAPTTSTAKTDPVTPQAQPTTKSESAPVSQASKSEPTPPQPVTSAKSVPSPSVPTKHEPIYVAEYIQAANLIFHPNPQYPSLARTARIEGIVLLSTTIATDGTIKDLKVISTGNPLLVTGVLDTIKAWRYKPTLIDKEPVEVITTITVNFTLGR